MGFENFDHDRYCAERLQLAFRKFIWEFSDEDSESAGATCRKLLNDETYRFKGGSVGQMPEEFTQRTIVAEVLNALGYTITHHPAELVKDERTQPDIKLENVGEKCVGIVECKALNRERNGREAIENLKDPYLERNSFAKYKKYPNMKYLVGIATDGFDWKLRVKDIEAGELVPEFGGTYSLVDDSNGLHYCYHSELKNGTNLHWPDIRRELAENFVSTFSRRNLRERF
ncbi:hypothetical protein NGM10_16690 (plasmid) [Halorussus salilacus]|uniref:hypothetical protein n=1 Tax=Halorussus salilacus TaxID=2953750 RepID=UPI00209EF7DE|nr:hypothetical protein [Halorussus salilacus]USZ69735.1 hypothetical protein NGM10_16690 [Halorussus salilacus]